MKGFFFAPTSPHTPFPSAQVAHHGRGVGATLNNTCSTAKRGDLVIGLLEFAFSSSYPDLSGR